tara:strand:- start:81 stop:254 length:174 start_codon:yes stop_codon:yes gene_type:complete
LIEQYKFIIPVYKHGMDDFVALCFLWFLMMGVLIVVLSNEGPERAPVAREPYPDDFL